jgi:group II intron reverse transcriptase/maturase
LIGRPISSCNRHRQQSETFASFLDAWHKVHEKNGAPGVDGETIDDFEENLEYNLHGITEQFVSDRYQLSPLKCVPIPKDEDNVRYIGIPTVRDRIVLRAVNTHLSAIWDPHFSEHSFGYRPGRNCRDAARALCEAIKRGNVWFARGDIRGCFDSLGWGYLSALLRHAIIDSSLRKFVNLSFRVPFLFRGALYGRSKGIPMGSPVSPALANVYLHQFDAEMSDLGFDVVRYGDDWICAAQERAGAIERLRAAQKTLSDMKIEINRAKSGVGDLRRDTITFLGYEVNAYEISSASWNMEAF